MLHLLDLDGIRCHVPWATLFALRDRAPQQQYRLAVFVWADEVALGLYLPQMSEDSCLKELYAYLHRGLPGAYAISDVSFIGRGTMRYQSPTYQDQLDVATRLVIYHRVIDIRDIAQAIIIARMDPC